MNISRDGQAGEGRKGAWKRRRERREWIWNKVWILIVVLEGEGPFQRLLCSFLPEPGDEGSIIPIELCLRTPPVAGHFPALPTSQAYMPEMSLISSLARKYSLSLSIYLAWLLVLFYVVGALLRTIVTFDQYILKSQVGNKLFRYT